MSRLIRIQRKIIKAALLVIGWLSVILGVIGIFLPVMPTTPFLLLAAACFMRTSPKFYNWLVGHPQLGKYVVYYMEGKGIPFKAKIYTIVLMALGMSFTIYWVPYIEVKIILPLIGVLVALYILRQPTLDVSLEVKE